MKSQNFAILAFFEINVSNKYFIVNRTLIAILGKQHGIDICK